MQLSRSLTKVLLLSPLAVRSFTPALPHRAFTTARFMSTDGGYNRKPGVSAPSEIRDFVTSNPGSVIVVDARNPDFTIEPGDAKSSSKAPLAGSTPGYRPNSVNLVFDRVAKGMDLKPLEDMGAEKTTPIITHCGGGGRGQKAKDFLIANGYTNVINGGGPEDSDCWAEFGSI
ncbi:hypothetical protein TrCOL_g10137 [Triparma columacea]|uniref:Rhodanese domain-containing protein n=1 Tax=Triparma columacea TaxID=722753 RepID=A0A9W7G3M2_9STRA|nr:hypothetical protein TrCOL_g10137 [Triparma columacea]